MPELFTVVTIAEANARLARHILPQAAAETVGLDAALHRVLAEGLVSPVDLPGFPRATMDGYAVRAADTFGASEGLPAYLTLAGEVPMGRAPELALAPGQAARIHTGGMLPQGSDAVVMVEHTQAIDAALIEVLRPVAVGEHMLPVGDDVRYGAPLFARGHVLRAQDLGALSGVGITRVPVVRRPRVAILATGDEVVPADTTPGPGQVRDVNSHLLAGLVQRHGGEPQLCGIAPDDAATLREQAREALDAADALIVSAGSSVSTRDVTAATIASLGSPGVLVHGVSIQPGKPTIMGVADNKPLFGLPGNPVSTLVAFELFVAPALYRWQGADPAAWVVYVAARLTRDVASVAGREDFVPVRFAWRAGERWAEPIFGKSNLIYTAARADGLLHVPLDNAGLYAGEAAQVRLF
jgi:molybdopterin molybdotransferase